MSIEKNLERIASGVEQIVAMLAAQTMPKTEVSVAKREPYTTGQTVATPVVEKAAVAEAVVVNTPEPTEDEVRNAVRTYMNANGKDKAISLLIKHGAKAEKPMIKDVTNKTALMAEIM